MKKDRCRYCTVLLGLVVLLTLLGATQACAQEFMFYFNAWNSDMLPQMVGADANFVIVFYNAEDEQVGDPVSIVCIGSGLYQLSIAPINFGQNGPWPFADQWELHFVDSENWDLDSPLDPVSERMDINFWSNQALPANWYLTPSLDR